MRSPRPRARADRRSDGRAARGEGAGARDGKPLIAVNHLEGHALSPRLADPDLAFPICCCWSPAATASCSRCAASATIGGLPRPSTMRRARRSTRPPSCSACLSRRPGDRGRWRRAATPTAVPLPRPLVGSGEPHFSFAGLKSAVQRAVASGDFPTRGHCGELPAGGGRLPCRPHAPGAGAKRCAGAGRRRAASRPTSRSARRSRSSPSSDGRGFSVPPGWLCTDNAAMIAWAGAERFARVSVDRLDVPARARWPLDESAEKVRGAGVKA